MGGKDYRRDVKKAQRIFAKDQPEKSKTAMKKMAKAAPMSARTEAAHCQQGMWRFVCHGSLSAVAVFRLRRRYGT